LIKSQYLVVKNHWVAFFPNDPKTCQAINLKASSNVLFESMFAKKTVAHDPVPEETIVDILDQRWTRCQILPKKSHSKKRWLIDLSWSQPPEHKTELAGRTPLRLKLSFVGILFLISLQTKRDTFNGINLLQIDSEWMLKGISSVVIKVR